MEYAPSPSSPQFSAGEHNSEEADANVGSSHSSEQVPKLSLWERLGKAAMLDIESNDFSWSSLFSLCHTKHTSTTEPSEDELNKAQEVTVNSGGVVFIALFSTSENSDTSPKEAAAVLKFASSRMATQSERLGYEFAKWLGVRTPQENGGSEINVESSDNEIQKLVRRPSRGGSRESVDLTSPVSRESWNVRYFRGNGDQNRSLRLTMKLRDFNKFAKVDAELNKELEEWYEMLRMDVIKLCQENNFNTGFFEGSDSNIAIDAYELKVRLEHILERISMISDAASTERPSPITDNLYIGGALAARSMYTLQHLGITHILCLCSNEIGQADSQYPYLFDYRNFSIQDNDDEDISDLFQETSDFIDYVEYLGGKVLVHCFEGRSRSATVVLAYLILRKNLTLLEAWSMLKKVHRRAQPNDGFAKILLDLDKRLHGKISMEWQHRKPTMKVCPICGKNAGLSSSSLKLHLQKSHKKISSGSVDSAMTLEIQKAIEALKISRGGSVSPTQKHSQSLIKDLAS